VVFDPFDTMEARRMNVPTLVICGNEDVLAPPQYSRYRAGAINDARLESIEGAGHMVMVERPKIFN
jgi:3-oxoadipate enol-lactonase